MPKSNTPKKLKPSKRHSVNKHSTPMNSAMWRNEARMKILAMLPSFQKDVAMIREKFDIHPGEGRINFTIDGEGRIHHTTEDIKKFFGSPSPLRGKAPGEIAKLRAIAFEERKKRNAALDDSIRELGKKYRLPRNFYNSKEASLGGRIYDNHFAEGGLARYVRDNEIVPPHYNWVMELGVDPEIFAAIHNGGDPKDYPPLWITIRTFMPLRNAELAELVHELKHLEKKFSKEASVPMRQRKQFDRDLEIFQRLSFRKKRHPKRGETYQKGSYLDIATRSNKFSAEEIRDLERKNPSGIEIGYNDVIAREIAKELHISPDAVRKAKERIEALAKKLLGVDLGPGQQEQ